MRIDILTLFPDMFSSVLGSSILKRAAEDVTPIGPGADKTQVRPAVVSYHTHDIRDYTTDKHGKVDKPPFGGGPGMVMKPEVWGPALDDVALGTTAPTLESSLPHLEKRQRASRESTDDLVKSQPIRQIWWVVVCDGSRHQGQQGEKKE